jgi:seryl-tRNA synthetase
MASFTWKIPNWREKDVRIAREQDLRAALSREHDQLAAQLEAAKKNLGSGGMALVQQVNEKDREIEKLKAQSAKEKAELNEKAWEIDKLKAELAEKQSTAAGNPILQKSHAWAPEDAGFVDDAGCTTEDSRAWGGDRHADG